MKQALILTVITLFGIQFSKAQSPWTREKGKAYVQLGFTSLSYNAIQSNGQTLNNIGDYNDLTIQAYTEYGISNKLEAQLILPYKSASYKNAGVSQQISGLSNITAGLKYKLSDKNWKISSGILFSANSITKNQNLVVSTTGINASTILPYVTIGSSFKKWYYFGTIGYGFMNNDYSDFLKATVEVGYNIIPKAHIMVVLDARNPLVKEKAFLNDNLQWASHADRQTFNAMGIKANYEFVAGKYGANVSTFSAFGIDNAPLSPTLNVGVYAKL